MKLFGRFVVTLSKLKVVWKEWDVRSFIVSSFMFQLILILIAPFRKRSSSGYLRVSTWISYLMADWVAAQAVGLIAKATQVASESAESDLFGLWAQFLLLHLGGPDTITALALEDNELWLRTALHLGSQAYATLGILVRSVRQSTLWIATVLMFLAGLIKYLERVTSLHHGRLTDTDNRFYKYLMTKPFEDVSEEEQKPLSNVEMIQWSYFFFQTYKGLYADLRVKYNARRAARNFFLKRTSEEAYKMVEIQLNFMYEAMYTKMVIVHKWSWWVLRHVVLSLQVACLVIWCFWDKRGFQGYDVRVTYALLIGAVVVDVVGLLRIQLSDWSIALLKKDSKVKTRLYNRILGAWDSVTWNSSSLHKKILGRWSMYICRYNGFSMFTWLNSIVRLLHLRDTVHGRDGVKLDWSISDKWDFIFTALTNPTDQVSYELSDSKTLNMNELLRMALPIHIMDYNTVLLLWYQVSRSYRIYLGHSNTEVAELYLALGEYIMYLVAFQPNMMYAAAGKGKVVSLQKEDIVPPFEMSSELEEEGGEEREEELRWIKESFGIVTNLESNRGEDRVRDALCQLKEVEEYIKTEEKWELLGRVWVELVCHAAITCRPNVHAARLKEGGEFLTFVWLLMVHLGFEASTFS